MSTTHEQIHDSFTAYLSVVRGGVKLPRRVIAALPTYLMETLKLKDPEEVEEMGVTGFVRALTSSAAYDDMLPEAVGESAIEWFMSEPGEKVLKKAAVTPPTMEGEVTEAATAKTVAPTKPRTTTTLAEEEADAKAMGLASGIAVRCLALSAETGQVHAPHEVGDMPWGSDPRLTDIAKQRRKSGMDSLTKHLDEKDADAVLVHFSSLIRDLTNEGETQEVSVVTGWLMEVQQVFASDKAGMLTYIKEYFRRYKGRAFPVKFDFAIFAKSLTSAKAGGMTDDQKEDLKKIKSMQSQLAQATSKIDQLKNELGALKNKVAGLKTGAGTSQKATCHFCHEEGHMAWGCKLNPDSTKYDAKLAKKKEAKKLAIVEEEEDADE
jgi:flagellin-like hook-associated protein FlgL